MVHGGGGDRTLSPRQKNVHVCQSYRSLNGSVVPCRWFERLPIRIVFFSALDNIQVQSSGQGQAFET